jgi:23S rRNA pseudouridine1911/1915/1917 synthase
VVDHADGLSLVECRIETGRTHQIRVHMASLGCPVAGDKVYGKPALDKKLEPVPARQLLHAWRLELRHPVGGGVLALEAPVPGDFLGYGVTGGVADLRGSACGVQTGLAGA